MSKKSIKTINNPNGRPTVMTEAVLTALQECFELGMPKNRACEFVGIDRDTLLAYCHKNPIFSAKINGWRTNTSYKALKLVNSKLTNSVIKDENGKVVKILPADVETAKWWLERREKADFSIRTEITGEDGGAIEVKTVQMPFELLPKPKK